MSGLLALRASSSVLFSTSSAFHLKTCLTPGFLVQRRWLLSPAYPCADLWAQQRKKCESLKHIASERYFFELNQKFQRKGERISAVDIDIYINSIHRADNQDELEFLLKRFRSTKRTVDTLDSTHHAVCRFYLRNDKRDQLLKILNERVTFGIFPDIYMYNIILDSALVAQDLEQALDTIKLMMLQEDAGNDITKTLALHTLIQLLNNGQVGPKSPVEGEEEEAKEAAAAEGEDDDDEINYVRIPYLRNPFFDDHFDLTNRDHIYGKCLYFLGHELAKSKGEKLTENDVSLAASAQIIGLIFYQKWAKLNQLLDSRLKGAKVTPDVLEIAQKHLELIQDDETLQKELPAIVERLKGLPQESTRLQALIEARVATLPELEPADIKGQAELFEHFETTRVAAINAQLDDLLTAQRRAEIEAGKQDIEHKKRLYYFFENFPKHEIDFVEAEQRIKEFQSKTVVDEDYIPPEREESKIVREKERK